jgi:hypothetical protein
VIGANQPLKIEAVSCTSIPVATSCSHASHDCTDNISVIGSVDFNTGPPILLPIGV